MNILKNYHLSPQAFKYKRNISIRHVPMLKELLPVVKIYSYNSYTVVHFSTQTCALNKLSEYALYTLITQTSVYAKETKETFRSLDIMQI